MHCGYGLAAIPGSDVRLFTPETYFLRLRRTVNPIKIQFGSFKIKAKIHEARKERSFYELLGIPETGTLPEIKQAYKQLARKYHPDVSPPDRVQEYTERFIRVQEAYKTLSDPRSRALYDRDLAVGINLAFSARRRYRCEYDKELEERGAWRNCWQSQLSELKQRSMTGDAEGNMSWGARMRRDAEGNMSWGARMRRQRDELSKEQ